MGVLFEHSLADFIIVTLFLGCGAAILTGRAIALSWEPLWRALLWTLPLAAAVRFIHFSIFGGTLLSPWFFLVDLVFLVLSAAIGHRVTRTRQMTTRYGWRIRPHGFWSWSLKPPEG